MKYLLGLSLLVLGCTTPTAPVACDGIVTTAVDTIAGVQYHQRTCTGTTDTVTVTDTVIIHRKHHHHDGGHR